MTAPRLLGMAGILAAVFLAGCSPEIVPFVDPPATTPTPLATARPEATSATPKATAKPEATPAPATGAFYKPPGWNGSADVNCKDFDTHAHAQSFFTGTGGSSTNDPYGLDGDHDGKACETLP